jgi:DNA-binding CsgD family transcriptional regulator
MDSAIGSPAIGSPAVACPPDVAAGPVTVAVQASDAIIGAGAAAFLQTRPGITPLPARWAHQADVILMLADPLSEDMLSWMRQVSARAAGAETRFVLASCGLISVLPRQGCDYQEIVRAIVHLHQGRVELPGAEFRSLLARARPQPMQTTLLAPAGLDGASVQLNDRERDVLRLLADGHGTPEIAKRLSYSERTVKNIIHHLLTRMKLRNRPHAVAYALRNGLL